MENKNQNQEKISIYFVEDYLLIRKSLVHILNKAPDMEVIQDFVSAEQCLEALKTKPVDIVIMDLGLPGINGLEATQIITNKYPETKVIILTSHENENEVLAAMAMGAKAYCLKDTESETMYTIIRQVQKGALWIHPQVANFASKRIPKPNSTDFNNLYTQNIDFDLTDREREVLKLVVEGKSNTEIAEKIVISTHTAKAHVGNILSKLAVTDRVQAAVKAVRNGII